jgi:hypothetical protein
MDLMFLRYSNSIMLYEMGLNKVTSLIWGQWDLNLTGKRVQLVFLIWDQELVNCF